MIDLTKITTPFGLLSPEVQQALKDHGGPYEFCNFNSHGYSWGNVATPNWYHDTIYRVKEKSKPSIDWSHVNKDYQWLARDLDGEVYLYKAKPQLCSEQWALPFSRIMSAQGFASLVVGDCHWKDSLVERPEGE